MNQLNKQVASHPLNKATLHKRVIASVHAFLEMDRENMFKVHPLPGSYG